MKVIKAVLISTICSVYLFHPALVHAMEFRIFYQAELKLNIIVGEGKIIEGDAARFLSVVKSADKDRGGHVIMALNSLGGSVEAAFELGDAMDEVGVFTLVPDGALCASACASIVYISGVRRDLLGDGRLGFHTCYHSDGKTTEESSFCNERIAKNAMEKGFDHASVSLFVDEFGPDEMAWIGRDVACTMLYGMCRPSLNPQEVKEADERYYKMIWDMAKTFSTPDPSFDCKKARTTQETIICNDRDLSRLDRDMAKIYKKRLSSQPDSKKIMDDQRSWLRLSRSACGDKECLMQSYNIRIKELTNNNKAKSSSTSEPSFDCKKARTNQEIMICNDRNLSRLDSEMNKIYGEQLSLSSGSKKIRREQRSWLRNSRNACGDKECLIRSYNMRIKELTKLVQ